MDLMCSVDEASPMESLGKFCASWIHAACSTPNTVIRKREDFMAVPSSCDGVNMGYAPTQLWYCVLLPLNRTHGCYSY